jgi:hypothetical protein
MAEVSVELVPLARVTVTLERPLRIKDAPYGTRFTIGMTEGRIDGERLKGTLKGPAGDWFLMGAGGVGTLHVHGQIETDDGALIYVQYEGRQNVSQGTGSPLFVAPTFQTGDERYAWLNNVQAVGKGLMEAATLTYEWFEVR